MVIVSHLFLFLKKMVFMCMLNLHLLTLLLFRNTFVVISADLLLCCLAYITMMGITFHYNRHEDNAYVEQKLPVIDFIKLLIQHIPEKHFKMTRYYGLYARNRSLDNSLNKLIPSSRHKILLAFNTWRNRIASCFGYDPIQCPNCKKQMELLDLYYKHTKVSLEDLYERTMAKMKHHAGGKAALFSFPSVTY